MTKQERIEEQTFRDNAIRKKRDGWQWITKGDSLNVRAKKLELAIDMPAINRSFRRRDLKSNIVIEIKTRKQRLKKEE
jgi:hypothetical protein